MLAYTGGGGMDPNHTTAKNRILLFIRSKSSEIMKEDATHGSAIAYTSDFIASSLQDHSNLVKRSL
jgi:hypothetical protein